MPSDNVINTYIGKLGPEFLFTIGILAILSYIAIKSIPAFKELRMKRLDNEIAIEQRRLDLDERREMQKAEEHAKMLEREQEQQKLAIRQLEQGEIQTHAIEAQTVQLAALQASLEESKNRSRSMGDTIDDIHNKVTEMHTTIKNKAVNISSSR